MKIKSFLKNYWQGGIATIAVILSIFTIFRSCARDKKTDEHTYKIDALNHRPLLRIKNTFVVDSIILDSFFIEYPPIEKLLKATKSNFLDSVIVRGESQLMGHLKFYNDGNDIASIVFTIVTIDNTAGNIIRKALLENKKMNWNIDSMNLVFKLIDILPGDSFEFPVTAYIKKSNNPYQIILHYLILYENQHQMLFDTYSMIIFDMEPIKNDTLKLAITGNKIIPLLNNKKIIQVFNPSAYSSSFNSYEEKQKNDIYKKIKKIYINSNKKVPDFLKNTK